MKVIIGERYSFAVEHEVRCMMYLFCGNLAILLWKSGNVLVKEIKYLTEEEDAKKKNKTVLGKRNMIFN